MDSVAVAFELMRIELDTEVENLNTEGARHFRASEYDKAKELGEKGKELQRFLEKVRSLEAEWTSTFAAGNGSRSQDLSVEVAARKILSGAKSSKTRLLVRFESGEVIAEDTAAKTLAAVVERAGFERVERLGLLVNGENIVSRTRSQKYYETNIPPYFIKTHSSTAQKMRNIQQISDALKLNLKVEVI